MELRSVRIVIALCITPLAGAMEGLEPPEDTLELLSQELETTRFNQSLGQMYVVGTRLCELLEKKERELEFEKEKVVILQKSLEKASLFQQEHERNKKKSLSIAEALGEQEFFY